MSVYAQNTEILLARFNVGNSAPVWGIILKTTSSSESFYPDIKAGAITTQTKPSHYALSYLDHMSVSSASSAGNYVEQARSIIKQHPFGLCPVGGWDCTFYAELDHAKATSKLEHTREQAFDFLVEIDNNVLLT
ncbi:hypothetical protein BKA70DRAFT_1229141 [Coprinopsis sp. MPI-PUGE-AT-0042]|nr:hypothetical protein BKA70DRAFT_1229141 [Coprinopsis sp. MPI-PUGE-AT-0042]